MSIYHDRMIQFTFCTMFSNCFLLYGPCYSGMLEHCRYNIILYNVILYYVILYYIILCYVMLCYVILYYIILYHIILYYIILYYIILCYIILYYIILYYITLYYICSENENANLKWMWGRIWENVATCFLTIRHI